MSYTSEFTGAQIDNALRVSNNIALNAGVPVSDGNGGLTMRQVRNEPENSSNLLTGAAIFKTIKNEAKPPYIGANSNWYLYDPSKGEYVDSGKSARGEKGDKGDNYDITPDDYESIAEIAEEKYANDLNRTNNSLDALWKLSKGIVYDTVEQLDSGMNDAPSGSAFFSVDDVRGNTTQGANPTPTAPQEIKSIDSFTVINTPYATSPYADWKLGWIAEHTDETPYINPSFPNAKYGKEFRVKNGDKLYVRTTARNLTGLRLRWKLNGNIVGYYAVKESNNEDVIVIPKDCSIIPLDVYGNLFNLELKINSPFSDADEIVSRTIAPPRPLNAIGENVDKANIESGEWEYACGEVQTPQTVGLQSINSYGIANFNFYNPFAKGPFVSSHFVLQTSGIASTQTEGVLCANANEGFYRINQSRVNTVAAMNQWLNANNVKVLGLAKEPTTEPINGSDLAFLRSLENIPADHHLIVTDNHGRDVSYLVEYIRKLSEVG